MKNWRTAALLIALAASSLATPVAAQAQGQENPLAVSAENLMADDARHQELADQGQDPSTLLPGDVVRFQLTFTNITDGPVRNVEFNDPLPAGLQYLGGTAMADREDVVITYSIDGGQTFLAQPMIEEVIDGERVTRPAPPEMYTHIRWLVSDWVQPGAQVTAEFRAQLPVTEAPEEPGQS
jgi:uncharacterized repeat protein (TIGR01451 family)